MSKLTLRQLERHLFQADFKDFGIPLPVTAKRRAVAEILADVVQKTQQPITRLKQIKQGMFRGLPVDKVCVAITPSASQEVAC